MSPGFERAYNQREGGREPGGGLIAVAIIWLAVSVAGWLLG
jgi:hypothetical protein